MAPGFPSLRSDFMGANNLTNYTCFPFALSLSPVIVLRPPPLEGIQTRKHCKLPLPYLSEYSLARKSLGLCFRIFLVFLNFFQFAIFNPILHPLLSKKTVFRDSILSFCLAKISLHGTKLLNQQNHHNAKEESYVKSPPFSIFSPGVMG